MTELRLLYKRLYGYMCVLLLLQEFHIAMATDVNNAFHNMHRLSSKLKSQQTDLTAKARGYIKDCSEDHIEDIKDLGSPNSPPGVIGRLMLALLYTVVECGSASREILADVIDKVGVDTVNNVIDTIYETAVEMEKEEHASGEEMESPDEEDVIDETTRLNDNAFLSELLDESILNTKEMFSLFESLADGNEFENATDVENMMSDIDEFGLEEIIDRPNYEWISYPSETEANGTTLKKPKLQRLVDSLNSNSTKRLIREMTIPVQADIKTSLLIIYDKNSHYLLGVNDNDILSLSDYDETRLQQQLWVIDDGQVLNVGSHLALQFHGTGNKSTPVVLGEIDSTPKWRLYGGHLVTFGSSHCLLEINSSSEINKKEQDDLSVIVDCPTNIADISVSVIFFKDANTPQKFIQVIDRPLSYLESLLTTIANSKILVFCYLLVYMIRSSVPGYNRPSSPAPSVRLDNTFFIKHADVSCKVLRSRRINNQTDFVFEDFSEDTIEYQLWYWKENQIINVGTQSPIEMNKATVDDGLNAVQYGSKFFRLWYVDNGKISSFINNSCELILNDLKGLIVDCRNTSSIRPWSFVTFDKPNFSNFVDVVCLYFIQSSVWPCEFLTSSQENNILSPPRVSPLVDNIFPQLWYMSNGLLVNADTGRPLATANSTDKVVLGQQNLTKSIHLDHNKDSGVLSDIHENVITLDKENNGTLKLEHVWDAYNRVRLRTQHWKFLPLDMVSSDNSSLTCASDVELELFVIRNDQIPACKLLTVVEVNNGTFELQMKHYDGEMLERQVWANYGGSLINLASGLSIQPNLEKRSGSQISLFPGTLHAFLQEQKWSLDDNGTIRWKLNTGCFMDYEGDSVVMNCNDSHSIAPMWSFIDLPSDEEDLSNTLAYMCFYFIRSREEPCQYLTADPRTGNIVLRPLVADLLSQQLWNWNERIISLATSGQLLGIPEGWDGHGSPWIALINPDDGRNFTSWTLMSSCVNTMQTSRCFDTNGYLELQSHTLHHLSVDFDDNGKLFLTNSSDDSEFGFTFVDYETFTENDDDGSCSIPLDEDTNLFFIRSLTHNCLVLTGKGHGEQPTFEHFNQDDIESQLWFSKNDHIINLKTYLVLHADVETWVSGARIIMKPFYKYANRQKLSVSGDMIFYGGSESCVLDINKADATVIIWCQVHGGYNQRWVLVDFDDNSEYVDELTCMFFLRHAVTPCDLMTYTTDTGLVLRPVTEEFFNNQIWYWSGDHIINAASGRALDVNSYSHEITAHDKNSERISQKWRIREQYIVSEKGTYLVLGFESSTNKLKLLDRRYINNDNIRWSAVELGVGLNNTSLLSCEADLDNPTVYFIRSEKDPCHVLSETGGQITLLKGGTDNANQAWVKIRRHIVNAQSGRALEVTRVWNGEPVMGRTRYEHLMTQHWMHHGHSIGVSQEEQALWLDAYSDVCVWKEDGSQGQKWVWLNVKDVEDDTKLLRCSKCYNKKEETANEVMSYIPIFGWLYSLIRAPVYAAKGCDDVAIESLRDFAIGAILDIGVAIVTVLTLGTASAAALGVKTAVQSGIKAGIKAAVKAITSSVKLAVRQAINAGKVLLKQGLKKTVISLSKKGLTSIKSIIKSNIKTIKHIPSSAKSLVVKSGTSVKKLSTKLFNTVRKTSYGSLKSSVKGGLRNIPDTLKKKLKQIGNALAEKAENKIKKLDDLKKNKPTSHDICKRDKGRCRAGKKEGTPGTSYSNIPKTTAFIPEPDSKIKDNFNKLLKQAEHKNAADLQGIQNAHFGLSHKKLHSKGDLVFDRNTVHSKSLKEVDEFPFDSEYNRINKNKKGNKKPQSHTEQALLDDIDDTIKKNCGGQNCELYLWTKNSPCMKNTYKFTDNTIGSAKSCFAMLLELCHKHVRFTPGFKKCHIGFQDFFPIDGTSVVDPKKQFMEELTSLTETTTNLAEKGYRYPTLTKEALKDIGSFIKFYNI